MNQPSIVSSDISYMVAANQQMWAEIATTPLGKLRLADAYLGRISAMAWEVRKMMADELKGMIGGLVRECDPQAVLNDPHLVGMVRQLYGEPGVNRLKTRVQQKVLSSANEVRETPGQQPQGNSASPAQGGV